MIVAQEAEYIFTKEVDWSLLNYGFTIPQAAVNKFCSNVNGEVPRGGSLHIKLVASGEIYTATLNNICFSSNDRTVMQVRYSVTSPVAKFMRETFKASFDYFSNSKKANGVDPVQLDGKELVDVICVSPGFYGLICHPLSEDTLHGTCVETKKLAGTFTIKGAALKVMSGRQDSMTAKEIYDEIIRQNLYTFGAQNPVNVVRNILDSACDNSGYSEKYRLATPCFRFENKGSGKRVYSILEPEQVSIEKQGSIIDKTQAQCKSKRVIWDLRIEKVFHEWLGSEKYAQRTASNYCRAIAQTIHSYAVLAKRATEISNTEQEAVRKFIALLNKNDVFVEKNTALHYQFTAALSALERFYISGGTIVCDEKKLNPLNRDLMHEPVVEEAIFLPNGRVLKIDDVIDLDEAQAEMDSILCGHFLRFYGYSNKRLLFEAVKIALPMFLNDNDLRDEDSIFAVAKYLLGDKYVFYDMHIWQSEPNHPKTVSGLMVGFGRSKGGVFDAEEAIRYLASVKLSQHLRNILRTNTGREAFALYNEGKIVLTEYLNLSDERVAALFAALYSLFEEHDVKEIGYVIPRDISSEWFSRLPSLEPAIEWTPLLLQEVIARYPNRGVRVVLSGLTGQSIYTVASAFAMESSMLCTLADVAHLYLLRKQDFVLPKKMPTEELRLVLREAGMLTGNELISNLHKVLRSDHRFVFSEYNQTVFILER